MARLNAHTMQEAAASLRQQIEMLQSGKLRTHTKRVGVGLIDTTADSLNLKEHKLADIDALIARLAN